MADASQSASRIIVEFQRGIFPGGGHAAERGGAQRLPKQRAQQRLAGPVGALDRNEERFSR